MKTQRLIVEDGSVSCPQRGDVTIEVCARCSSLRRSGRDPVSEFVDCRAKRRGLVDPSNPDLYWYVAGILS